MNGISQPAATQRIHEMERRAGTELLDRSTRPLGLTETGKLFAELGPRYASRPGGYLSILKYGFRKGDNAPMALVALMDQTRKDGDEAGVQKAPA